MYYKDYNKEYNKRRNNEIWKLQKKKSYYKKIGDLEKIKTIDILINIEKRKSEVN